MLLLLLLSLSPMLLLLVSLLRQLLKLLWLGTFKGKQAPTKDSADTVVAVVLVIVVVVGGQPVRLCS